LRSGRNDPCPCGSGRKYKTCCLNRDRTARLRGMAWREDEQAALQKLMAFAQRAEFRAQITVAFNLFWNGSYGGAGAEALERDEVGRFLEWYAYDYRMEGSGKRAIELFAEQVGPALPPGDRERLAVWLRSYLGLYRIAGTPGPELLAVVDTLQGNELVVWDRGLGRLGRRADLVLGRILRSSEPAHFSWAAIVLPARQEEGLATFARSAYEEYRQTHLQASWPAFLSERGYSFNHYLLKSAGEAGQPRALSGTYYDAFRSLERLGAVEKRLRERAAKEMEKQRPAKERPEQKKTEPMRQTRGGILLPEHVDYKGSRAAKS
jgi:hypothetical protein